MTERISKNEPTLAEPDSNSINEDQEEQENLNSSYITSHLYLRPIHNSQTTLDRDAVLRRIRHRKRMNKVRNAIHGFFGWSVSVKTDKVSVRHMKWVDDAFSAP
ncbi:Histone-lysine N-methyltransferase [Melia azedarach]|uniref:Histone-lysine N-methyltransferase n=1 Tax=Melia azedarach TaxID=155640 RepID=A0ACC1WVB1_MELAZ|nr:Histone-lysine N-methyltransferase [Melia azedarach]